ncbi:MAG: DUF6544 family protein [Candidatus Dormiibacterota bacterium]
MMLRRFTRRITSLGLTAPGTDAQVVRSTDLVTFPESVQRYLRFMGVVDHARDWSFRAHFKGRFRMRPGLPWLPLDSWQYNFAPEVVRLFYMRLRVGRVVPMYGWDTYVGGYGKMLGKVLGLVTVADGEGEAFDTGELTTYLNDAIIFAPSMLLRDETSWSGVNDESFDVALSDAGNTVTARVVIDDLGAPRDFSSDDRFATLPDGLARTRWSTPIEGWHRVNGHPLPTAASAVWHLPDGPFPYAEFDLRDDAVVRNVAPEP